MQAKGLIEGVAGISAVIGVVVAFALLEGLSIGFRSGSLGLRYGCNGLAGHILQHILGGVAVYLYTDTG